MIKYNIFTFDLENEKEVFLCVGIGRKNTWPYSSAC